MDAARAVAHQVGGLPPLWTEWNVAATAYRCATSGGASGESGEFASRFTGSSDLYEADGRRPLASINFVTAHDGFTLHDLVSYNDKKRTPRRSANADL